MKNCTPGRLLSTGISSGLKYEFFLQYLSVCLMWTMFDLSKVMFWVCHRVKLRKQKCKIYTMSVPKFLLHFLPKGVSRNHTVLKGQGGQAKKTRKNHTGEGGKAKNTRFSNAANLKKRCQFYIPVYPKLITLIFRSLPRPNGHCYRKFIL